MALGIFTTRTTQQVYLEWSPQVSVRLANILLNNSITSWQQIADMSELDFMRIKGAGHSTIREVKEELGRIGLSFRKEEIPTQSCPECKKPFPKNDGRRIYCSSSCSQKTRTRKFFSLKKNK